MGGGRRGEGLKLTNFSLSIWHYQEKQAEPAVWHGGVEGGGVEGEGTGYS